jgi:serine protease Do
MYHRHDDDSPNRTETVSRSQYNRVVLILVAASCLSIGIAVGAVIRGDAGATPTDNRLTISNTSTAPDALSATFAKVAAQVEPCVVNIKVSDNEDRTLAREGTGSGVIVNSQGFILTNQHVVQNSTRIKVKLFDNTEYIAIVIGQDAETDLAVIKIEPTSALPVARIGDSERLSVGEWVLAIGSPLGLEQTVTAGIVSAKDRVAEHNQSAFQQFVQTDAAINPGNSGGPLVNLAGEVVGINTQIVTNTKLFSGIGLAMPSSTAVDVYNHLVAYGRVRRAFLGITPKDLTPPIVRVNKMTDSLGVLVEKTTDEFSPAFRAGITGGDVIVSVNNRKVRNFRELIRTIAALPIGSTANVAYIRGGKQMTAQVKLEERQNEIEKRMEIEPKLFDPRNPKGLPIEKPLPSQKFNPTLGLTVKFLVDEIAKQRAFDGMRGAYITAVEPRSIAHNNGILVDDALVEINYTPVRSLEDYQRLTKNLASGQDVVMKIMRRNPRANNRDSVIISFTMP